MAEITAPKPEKGRKRINKLPRVDMTAMVDVAFLLLTFFVLTTRMSREQTVMALTLPEESIGEVPASKMLHLIPGPHDSLHYFFADDVGSLKKESILKLRKIVREHVYKTRPLCREEHNQKCWDPIISIRPQKAAPYKALVETLDEMKISAVPKYSLSEITFSDSMLIGLAIPSSRVIED